MTTEIFKNHVSDVSYITPLSKNYTEQLGTIGTDFGRLFRLNVEWNTESYLKCNC